MKRKNVGIWVRVSTEDQVKGDSLEHHEERARMYAKMKNWNVKTVYNLAGKSGKSVVEYSETQRMINDIKRGYISGLIFSKIARLARNTKQLLELSDIFTSYNADLISIYENIDTSSPSGKLFFTLIGAMAQWEREEIVSRVKASVQVRAKLGKKLGGQAQFGFKWEGSELLINDDEAPIRKLMYELFLKIGKNTTVATQLNEMGYRTRSGAKFSRGDIKRWLREPISKGLRRAHYSEQNSVTKATQLKPQDQWYIHPCPPIVSEELWQKVNDILDEQDKKRKPISNRKVHVFTNYIYCHCGGKMNVRSRLTHYKCTNKECTNKIRREDLDEAFKSRLMQFLSNKKELETYFKQSEKKLKNKSIELEILKKKQHEVKEKLENILLLHNKGQIPTEAFNEYHSEPYKQSQQLKEQIIKFENEILSESNKQNSTSLIIQESKDIYEQWDTFTRDKKRSIIEAVLESIIIKQNEIDFNLKRLTPETQFLELGENGEQNDCRAFFPP